MPASSRRALPDTSSDTPYQPSSGADQEAYDVLAPIARPRLSFLEEESRKDLPDDSPFGRDIRRAEEKPPGTEGSARIFGGTSLALGVVAFVAACMPCFGIIAAPLLCIAGIIFGMTGLFLATATGTRVLSIAGSAVCVLALVWAVVVFSIIGLPHSVADDDGPAYTPPPARPGPFVPPRQPPRFVPPPRPIPPPIIPRR
jgi:hypothetical protein